MISWLPLPAPCPWLWLSPWSGMLVPGYLQVSFLLCSDLYSAVTSLGRLSAPFSRHVWYLIPSLCLSLHSPSLSLLSLFVYLYVSFSAYHTLLNVRYCVRNSTWCDSRLSDICRMNEQMKKEVKPNGVSFCTHAWCWLATCLDFPCPPLTLLPLYCQQATWSPVSQTKQKPTGGNFLTKSTNNGPHTGPFSLPSAPHCHTKEACGPPLVRPMPQTQGLASSVPLPLLSSMSFPSSCQCIHVFPFTHSAPATTFPGLPFRVKPLTGIFYTCSLCILTVFVLDIAVGVGGGSLRLLRKTGRSGLAPPSPRLGRVGRSCPDV